MSQNRIYGPTVTITSDNLNINAPLGVSPLVFSGEAVVGGPKDRSIYIGQGTGATSIAGSVSNSVVGSYSGLAINTAQRVEIFGPDAGTLITNQTDVNLFGYRAGWKATASNLVALGNQCFSVATGLNNCGTGIQTGSKVTTGAANTLYGNNNAVNLTTGSNNDIFGYAVAPNLTLGSNNLIFGNNQNGQNAAALVDGSNNIILFSDAAGPSDSGKIIIGKPAVHSTCYISGITAVSQTGPNVAVTVNGSGQLGVGAVSLREFKEDITPINEEENHLKLMTVLPRNYTFKSWTDKVLQHGVIIDEIKEVFPELVGQVPDHETGGKKDFYVNYEQFIALLIADLQYAWKSMHNLEARLAAVENK